MDQKIVDKIFFTLIIILASLVIVAVALMVVDLAMQIFGGVA